MDLYLSKPGVMSCAGNNIDELWEAVISGKQTGIKKVTACNGEEYFAARINDAILQPSGGRYDMKIIRIENAALEQIADDINAAKTSGKKMSNKGHIQVYVPKTFEESFDIINVVKDGITVLVNVEVCNPQVSQRIVDVLTGALVALGGQCKKMGEKQYIFSLNAEMTGAMDYVPSSGQGQYQNGYNYPFQNPFNPMQNPFGQNPMYQNDMGQNNQGFNQPQQNNNFNQNPYNNFNNQPNNRPTDRNTFNPNDYYNPPVSQF